MSTTNHESRKPSVSKPISDEELDGFAAATVRQNGYERSSGGIAVFEAHDRSISCIHRVAHELASSSESPFYPERHRSGERVIRFTKLGERLVQATKSNFWQIRIDYPLHRFSPVFEIFERLRRRIPRSLFDLLGVALPDAQAERILTFLIAGVALLRRKLRRDSLKVAHENFRRAAKDNFDSLLNAIEWASQRHEGAMVLRIDLHLRKLGSAVPKLGDRPDIETLENFLACRERFHRSFDRRFGRSLLGYAWALEYGRERGFHAHYLLVLDERVRDDHVVLVDQLGEKWLELTDGLGDFYNCNARAQRYLYRAVGRIRFDHADAIKGLHLVVSYMTLAPLFVKLDVRPGLKTFGKGRFPKAPLSRPGRPPGRSPRVPIKISVAEAAAAYVRYL